MKSNTQSRLEYIKKNGYTLDFSTVFNQAFENYKKIAMYAGLAIFVFFFLFTILAFGVLISIFGAPAILEFLKPENLKPEALSANTLATIAGVSILISGLLSPFSAALIKMAYCAEKNQEFHISTLFEFYKAPYFKELFLATFLVSLLSSILSNVISFIQIPIFNYIVTTILSLFTLLMIPLIIFGKLKAIPALETSVMIVSKQPMVLLLLLVVGTLATVVGLIGFCIGVFFTIPFIYSLYYAIYNEIIGFEKQSEEML